MSLGTQRNVSFAAVRSMLLALLGMWVAFEALAQESTVGVFDRHRAAVVKVEVSETGSGAKGVIGSGFFVGNGRRLVTNYHVVARLVHQPDRYVARIVDSDDREQEARLVALDVLHDLAILEVDSPGRERLAIAAQAPAQGTRLYALGYPHDIGITIVEGTYNGRMEHSLYGRLHFTGSLNPGMSGGPTIDGEGTVVGVNVATAGNQVSFLVPLESVAELLAVNGGGARASESEAEEGSEISFLEIVQEQLIEHQETYHGDSLVGSGKTVELGQFEVPTEPAPFFNCWADANRDEERPYDVVVHQCATDDELFISHLHRSGIVSFRHRVATSEELNRFRFYQLLTDLYAENYGWIWSGEKEVTEFLCESGFVENGDLTLKVAFCARRYKKLDRLYDVVLQAASVGEMEQGLVTSLVLAGVTLDKGRELAETYIGAIRWHP